MRVSFEIPGIPEIPLKKLLVAMAACSPILLVTVAIANNVVPPADRPPAQANDAQQKLLLPPPPPAAASGLVRPASGTSTPMRPTSAPVMPVAPVPETASSAPPAALHFNNPELKLTPQERAALDLAKKWKAGVSAQGIKPVPGADGTIRFLFGAAQPSIVCAVLQVCDVELQPGEQVNSLHLGDTARWTVEPAVTGTGPQAVQHLIIKPMDTGLETSLIVTTDRRTYHLRLRSHRAEFMPRVAFIYPDEAMAKWEAIRKQEQAAHNRQILPGTGEYLGNLDFDYSIEGQASGWKPLRPAGTATGTLKFPVPVNRSGENFSPIPLCAPPPEGGTIADVPLVFDIHFVYYSVFNLFLFS